MNKFVLKKVGLQVRGQEGDQPFILQDISLPIPAGNLVTLVGPSGSGKSTMLKLLNRLLDPTEGEIDFNGQSINSTEVLTLRRQVGMVMQQPFLFPGSVADNIKYGPALGGKGDDIRVEKYLELVQLEPEMATRDVETLSGGQQQRVALARCLANQPEVLLLDEPTSALDPVATENVEEVVLALVKKGLTVVWVTHDLNQAKKVGDYTALINAGKLIEFNDTQSFFEHPEKEMTRRFLANKRNLA